MRCLTTLLLTLVAIVVVIVLGLGYLGFIPGVSRVLGSDRPKDLGVSYAATDLQSVTGKVRTKVTGLPAGAAAEDSLKLSGSVAVNSTFTDRELTALIADHESKWAFYPVADCQVKINQDGSVEVTGILQIDRAYGYAAATGVSRDVVDSTIDRLSLTGTNVPFYVKGTLSVTNNQVSADIERAEIGRLPIPSDWISANKETFVSFAEDRIKAAGITVRSASFANGTLVFDGNLPESVQLSPAR